MAPLQVKATFNLIKLFNPSESSKYVHPNLMYKKSKYSTRRTLCFIMLNIFFDKIQHENSGNINVEV